MGRVVTKAEVGPETEAVMPKIGEALRSGAAGKADLSAIWLYHFNSLILWAFSRIIIMEHICVHLVRT